MRRHRPYLTMLREPRGPFEMRFDADPIRKQYIFISLPYLRNLCSHAVLYTHDQSSVVFFYHNEHG